MSKSDDSSTLDEAEQVSRAFCRELDQLIDDRSQLVENLQLTQKMGEGWKDSPPAVEYISRALWKARGETGLDPFSAVHGGRNEYLTQMKECAREYHGMLARGVGEALNDPDTYKALMEEGKKYARRDLSGNSGTVEGQA